MAEYKHLMYASRHKIEEIYRELYGDASRASLESSENASASVGGKLGAFLANIKGEVSGEIGTSEIKEINFNDELFQAKKVVNELLDDDGIPEVTDLYEYGGEEKLPGMCRFSTELALSVEDTEVDDETYLEATGFEGDVKFSGITSLDNWGSRSHLISAKKSGEPYPFQGIVLPMSLEEDWIDYKTFRVHYLFICGPEKELRDKWSNRQHLKSFEQDF